MPSYKDILRRFFHIRDGSKCNTKSRDIASQVYDEFKGIHGKVPVLMKKKQYSMDKILKLHNTWSAIKKSKKLGSKDKAQKFQIKLYKNGDLMVRTFKMRLQIIHC